jgi:hypothetical protein
VVDALADVRDRETWRMLALALLTRLVMSRQCKIGTLTLRGYLGVAFVLVIVTIVQVSVG